EGLSRSAIKGVIPISGVYDVSVEGLNLFTTVFGKDAEVRRKASPLFQVQGELPPFLILYADSDFRSCDVVSEKFCKVIQEHMGTARTQAIKDRNHLSVLLNATKPGDPVGKAILDFVAQQTGARAAAAATGQ